jgi:hypothetical protein
MPKQTANPWTLETFEIGSRSLYFVVRGRIGSREVFRKCESRYVAVCFVNMLNGRSA